jgi:hypothetical protein
MKRTLPGLIAGSVVAIFATAVAEAQTPKESRPGVGYMTRQNASGEKMILRQPATCGQCLANRRALGYDPATQGPGVCAKHFPGCK